MKKGFFIFKEAAFIFVIGVCIFFLAFGITHLLKRKVESKKHEIHPALYSFESNLRPLILDGLKAKKQIIDLPEVNLATNTITERLVKDSQLPFNIEILVMRSETINAVTFPGGIIVIYSGLIHSLESPEELSAVLAHEFGHVAGHDSIKALTRRISMGILFSTLGKRGGVVLVQRILREAAHINFSRSTESKADDFALDLLMRAEIDPIHLGKALENLKQKSDLHQVGITRYIDTHPDIDSRIHKAYDKSTSIAVIERKFNIDWDKVKNTLPPHKNDRTQILSNSIVLQ